MKIYQLVAGSSHGVWADAIDGLSLKLIVFLNDELFYRIITVIQSEKQRLWKT